MSWVHEVERVDWFIFQNNTCQSKSVLLGGGGGELEEGTETGGQKEAVERGGERAEGSRREAAEGDTRGKWQLPSPKQAAPFYPHLPFFGSPCTRQI